MKSEGPIKRDHNSSGLVSVNHTFADDGKNEIFVSVEHNDAGTDIYVGVAGGVLCIDGKTSWKEFAEHIEKLIKLAEEPNTDG